MSRFGLSIQPYLQLLQLVRNIVWILIRCVCVCIHVCLCVCVCVCTDIHLSCWYLIQSFESVKMLTKTEHYHSQDAISSSLELNDASLGQNRLKHLQLFWLLICMSTSFFFFFLQQSRLFGGYCLLAFTFSGNNFPFHETDESKVSNYSSKVS